MTGSRLSCEPVSRESTSTAPGAPGPCTFRRRRRRQYTAAPSSATRAADRRGDGVQRGGRGERCSAASKQRCISAFSSSNGNNHQAPQPSSTAARSAPSPPITPPTIAPTGLDEEGAGVVPVAGSVDSRRSTSRTRVPFTLVVAASGCQRSPPLVAATVTQAGTPVALAACTRCAATLRRGIEQGELLALVTASL